MSETKTYVFGSEGASGSGGMMSMLAPLLQKNGLDPNLLLAMNRNNGAFGGEGGWFIWVIFLFFLMGWGGNGWGNGNRPGLANEINNDYGRSLLMEAIGGNRNAISNLATQLSCSEGQIQSAIAALSTQMQNVGQPGRYERNAGYQRAPARQHADCTANRTVLLRQQDGHLPADKHAANSHQQRSDRTGTRVLVNSIRDTASDMRAQQRNQKQHTAHPRRTESRRDERDAEQD